VEYLHTISRLNSVVAGLSVAIGVAAPKVVLAEDAGPLPVPACAAVDRWKKTITVTVSTARMPSSLLAPVVAHELAHLRRRPRELGVFLVLSGLIAVLYITLGLTRHTGFLGPAGLPVLAAVCLLWYPTLCWAARRDEISADITSAHATGAEGARHYDGAAGWLDWPSPIALRWFVRPFRVHPWPPKRAAAFRHHAGQQSCGCRDLDPSTVKAANG